MAGNGTRKKEEKLSPGEKRRLRQLLVCLALFGAVFLGRGMDLGPVSDLSEQVGQLVREDMDVQEVFARMGESFSQGEPAAETFRALWDGVTHWGEPEADAETGQEQKGEADADAAGPAAPPPEAS